MTELSALATGFASLAHARAEVAALASHDVSWLLPGRQLRSVAERLAGAAQDARAGADALFGSQFPGGPRGDARYAADLLEQATVLTGDRGTWNAERGALLRTRDLLDDALEQARRDPHQAANIDFTLLASAQGTIREPIELGAEAWDQLADLSSLPPGSRPERLSHITDRDVARMRDEASRLREGLDRRNERSLQSLLRSIHVRASLTTRADAEQMLARRADELISGMPHNNPAEREYTFRTVDALRRLGDDLRPGAIDPAADADWIAAAELAGRGRMPPTSWDGWAQLRQVSATHQSRQVIERLFATAPQSWSGDQWRELAAVVRTRVDVDPKLLEVLGPTSADDLELVARRVTEGRGIPRGWDGATRLGSIRAALLWGGEGQAAARVKSMFTVGIGKLSTGDLVDLEGLRTLPDHLRPAGMDAAETAWRDSIDLRRTTNQAAVLTPNAVDALARMGAETRWTDQSVALRRVVDIIDRSPTVTVDDLVDLHAMSLLPDEVRPSLVRAGDTTWRHAAVAKLESRSQSVESDALSGIARMRSEMFEDPELARAALDRVDTAFEELAAAQRRFSGNGDVPRASVTRMRADIETLLALDPPDTERKLLETAREVADRNVRRMNMEIRDSYAGHVDYADLGRMRETIRLAGTLARLRMAEAVPAPAAAAAEQVAEAAGDAAAAAGDTIVW